MIRRLFPAVALFGACQRHPALAHQTAAAIADAGAVGEAGETLAINFDEPDAAEDDGPRIYALKLVTPILDRMEMPARNPDNATPEQKAVVRLGYLRKGASARIKDETPTKNASCSEGWYALVAGGYACGKFVTTDAYDLDLSDAPHPPYTDKTLPYDYGMSMGTGVPLYFRVPKQVERDKYESSIPVSNKKDKDKDKEKEKEKTVDESYVKPDDEEAINPWYLKQQTGEKPKVSLDDLRKTGRGDLIERRMVKGFYLALDIPINVRRRKERPQKFWRTTRSLLAPYEHVLVHESKIDNRGIWLNAAGETRKLPLAFVTGFKAHRYTIKLPDAGAPKKEDKPSAVAKRLSDSYDRWAVVKVTDHSIQDEHYRKYYEIDDGKGEYLRDDDISVTLPGPKPADIGENEKWIDVNVAQQSLVAFEGEKPVFITLVSSGRHNDDPEQDHHTPKGDFRIWEKHISATMEEDTATDGPYSIEDVPWIMYFHGGYALHGAFWHAKFGHERSHGCVNLAPVDAKDLFGWTGPRLPPGWHGVRAIDSNPGTRVIVHD
jgi:hypothetical protein